MNRDRLRRARRQITGLADARLDWLSTHGDLSRSPRHRSHEAFGIGDELRVSLVIGGIYWAAASLLRDAGERWFTEDERSSSSPPPRPPSPR